MMLTVEQRTFLRDLKVGGATRGRIAMMRIMGTLPVKTRLPMSAWVVAGFVTLFSLASSFVQFTASGGATALAEQVHHASATNLLGFLRQFENERPPV
jgi:hypothetical protein